VPPVDNVHGGRFSGVIPTPNPSGEVVYGGGSCFDIVQEVRNDPRRPPEWADAAQRWADRLVNGETGARGDPDTIAQYGPDRIWLGISPVPGKPGYGQPICGHLKPRPTPTPSPSHGPGGGDCQGHPNKCTPIPSPVAVGPARTVQSATPLVPIFGIPMLAGHLSAAAAVR